MRMTTMVLAVLVSMFWLAPPAFPVGQETGEVPSAGDEEWTSFTKAYMEITDISVELQAALARPESKSEEAQIRVRESTRRKIQQVLQEHGLSETRYDQLSFVISTNNERRDAFTQRLEELSARRTAAPGPEC